MEGVAYSLCDCNEILQEMGVKVDCMKACGGGGKSPVWRQMLADLYNCSVERVVQDEGPALGVAILAGVACGLYESVEKATPSITARSRCFLVWIADRPKNTPLQSGSRCGVLSPIK